MDLLINKNFRDNLEKQAQNSNESIIIISAYIKLNALKWLYKLTPPPNNLKVQIVARFSPNDIISGASDLEACKFARSMNWKFRIDQNLHSKLYLFDEQILLTGSANFTNRGLHLYLDGNFETGVKFSPNATDIHYIKEYVDSCSLVTDTLYDEMEQYVTQHKDLAITNTFAWPSTIIAEICRVKKLWVKELFFSTPTCLSNDNKNNSDVTHDIKLLGIEPPFDRNSLELAFYQTKAWHWLLDTIHNESEQDGYILFGKVTATLHNILLDDPTPYRKEVKTLVSNLFEWVRWVKPREVGVKKFNHTEALFQK